MKHGLTEVKFNIPKVSHFFDTILFKFLNKERE